MNDHFSFSEYKNLKIKIVAIGSGTKKVIERLMESEGTECLVILDQLSRVETDLKKIVLKGTYVKGLGGLSSEFFEKKLMEHSAEIEEFISDSDIVFILSILGGNLSTGAPVIAKISRDLGKLTIALVTFPMNIEGKTIYENASNTINKMAGLADAVIKISIEDVMKLLDENFSERILKLTDEILYETMKAFLNAIKNPICSNFDFSDLKEFSIKDKIFTLGIGESECPEERVKKAVIDAINSPMVDLDISRASDAILLISGDPSVKPSEIEEALELITKMMKPGSRIISICYDDELKNMSRVFLMLN